MSSVASYDAAVAFLEGDSGDVLSTINAEQLGLLVPGSVKLARAPRGKWPRIPNPFPISVEIVPRGESPVKAVGIGLDEVGQVFDLGCCVRKNTTSDGKAQLNTAEDMVRALVRRYRLVSLLSPLYVTGSTVTVLGLALAGWTINVTASAVLYPLDASLDIGGSLGATATAIANAINATAGLNAQVLATASGVVVTLAPFRGCTSLTVALVAGGTGGQLASQNGVGPRLVRSDALRLELDADVEPSARVRAVTRVTFTFLETRASNFLA